MDKSAGLWWHQIIMLHSFFTKKDYPEKPKSILYYDKGDNCRLIFLTSNCSLHAQTITNTYIEVWLANRIVFVMDRTASQKQGVL
jgi:hypothetical protein